jgi:hypothetical protein
MIGNVLLGYQLVFKLWIKRILPHLWKGVAAESNSKLGKIHFIKIFFLKIGQEIKSQELNKMSSKNMYGFAIDKEAVEFIYHWWLHQIIPITTHFIKNYSRSSITFQMFFILMIWPKYFQWSVLRMRNLI